MAEEIGEADFARWRYHKILPLSDLLIWAAKEGRKLSVEELGQWLFEDRSDPEQAVIEALEERRRAFGMLPALEAQVNKANHQKE